MGDLIDRQDAIDLIEDIETKRLKGEIGLMYAHAIRGLKALPSAQSEIVRCEECEYKMECYCNVIMKSSGFGTVYYPLEYCSEGKRKDG